jgi:hypothetical protein
MANALQNLLQSFGQGASNSAASTVSAPVDGIAWLLRKAGLNVPEPMGGSDWMERNGLTARPKNAIAGLLGETAGMLAPLVVAAKAPQIAGGLLSLDDKAMDMARRGAEGYMNRTGMQQNMLYHGGEMVKTPIADKQGVLTRGMPAVSTSPNMLEAARYAIHNNGPINAIDDVGMKIYQQGQNKALDKAYKAGNFDAIRDAGFDGVKLFHSSERVLFDPQAALQKSRVIAENAMQYGDDGVLRRFKRVNPKP